MARSDPPPGRVALAPPVRPVRGPGGPPSGRGPARPPQRPSANYGRRRLLAVAIIATVAVLGYLIVNAVSGGGGAGGGGGDAYTTANHELAAQGTSMVQAGSDLRTLRDIGVFRRSVEASVATIGRTITTLNGLVSGESANGRRIIRQTVASGQQIATIGSSFETDITKNDLGAANRDEAAINAEIAKLQQQAAAWTKR